MKLSRGPRRLARRLTYANVVATLALALAIGGGSAYAASRLITGRQIAPHTISATNIKRRTLTASLFKRGTVRTGRTGATGATGPAGPAGPAGAPGSAIAYGDLSIDSLGNPVFNSTVSKGFTSVSEPSTGVFCIPYPAGVTTNVPLSIDDAGGATGNWEQYSPQQCGGSGFEIADPGAQLNGELAISVP